MAGQPDAYERFVHVGSLLRRRAIVIDPGASVADAAMLMAREQVSSLLIPHPGGFGIVTDRDLRTKVVAARAGYDTPVFEVMSSPARTISATATAGEALLDMLEGGFHHLPVTDPTGEVVGVVSDTDLMGFGRRSPFGLKTTIERATSRDEIVRAAAGIPDVVREMVDTSVDPVDIGRTIALMVDALVARLVFVTTEEIGEPPVRWAWLALGSGARMEQGLHSDQDHAIAYEPQDRPVAELDPYFARLAEAVTDGLERCGIPRCKGGAMAVEPSLRRPLAGWVSAFRSWMSDLNAEGSVQSTIAFDHRRVVGSLDTQPAFDAVLVTAPSFPWFIRHMAFRALEARPPTGIFGNLVVEEKGGHRGRLDIKHGGILIVTSLARAYALATGITDRSTLGRLAALEDAGGIGSVVGELAEAFRFLWGVRFEHQARLAGRAEEPDDLIDPAEFGPVARRGLREAFGVIRRAQRLLATGLRYSTPPFSG